MTLDWYAPKDMITYLRAQVTCVKCVAVAAAKRISAVLESACIQTKLFSADESSCSQEYQQGDCVLVDGLCDYCEIQPANDSPVLNVVLGDWECSVCHLNNQWAIAELWIVNGSVHDARFEVVIKTVKTFVPSGLNAFSRVHFVEEELVALALSSSSKDDIETFRSCCLQDRIDAIAAGYRQWYYNAVYVK